MIITHSWTFYPNFVVILVMGALITITSWPCIEGHNHHFMAMKATS